MVPPSVSPAKIFSSAIGWAVYECLLIFAQTKSTVLAQSVSPSVTQKPSHPGASSSNPIRYTSTPLVRGILSLEEMFIQTCSGFVVLSVWILYGPD
jgi:hypothetical protein